jgi:hypothetical protein
MLDEHAITYQGRIKASDLDYIIKKANRLGMSQRQVVGVYEETDKEGTHVYFNVTEQYGNQFRNGRTLS